MLRRLRGLLESLRSKSMGEENGPLERILYEAWSRAGLLNRVDDPSFPYSAQYNIPQQVTRDMLALLALMSPDGMAFQNEKPRPRYQEKITIPFLEAAYDRLQSKGQIEESILADGSFHLATAPLSSIYPRIHREMINNEYYVVFDTGMMFNALISTNAIWAIGEQLSVADNLPPTLEDVLSKSSPAFLAAAASDLEGLAESLFNLVASDWPIPTVMGSLERIYKNPVAAEMIGDFYTFSLAHELSHVELGHFDIAAKKQQQMFLEIDADTAALAKTLRSRSDPRNTLPGLVATIVLFETMGLIYRTVNFLAFQRDYRHMSPEAMTRLYFPSPNQIKYPHPRTRMYALMERVKSRHPEFADRMDSLEYHSRAFFDNVWESLESRMAPMTQKPTNQWRPVVELHKLAHE